MDAASALPVLQTLYRMVAPIYIFYLFVQPCSETSLPTSLHCSSNGSSTQSRPNKGKVQPSIGAPRLGVEGSPPPPPPPSHQRRSFVAVELFWLLLPIGSRTGAPCLRVWGHVGVIGTFVLMGSFLYLELVNPQSSS